MADLSSDPFASLVSESRDSVSSPDTSTPSSPQTSPEIASATPVASTTAAAAAATTNPYLKSFKSCSSYTSDEASASYSELYNLVNPPCLKSSFPSERLKRDTPPYSWSVVQEKTPAPSVSSEPLTPCHTTAAPLAPGSGNTTPTATPTVNTRQDSVRFLDNLTMSPKASSSQTARGKAPTMKSLASNLKSRLSTAIQKVPSPLPDHPVLAPGGSSSSGSSPFMPAASPFPDVQHSPAGLVAKARREVSPLSTNSQFSSINSSSYSSSSSSSDSSDSDSDSDFDLLSYNSSSCSTIDTSVSYTDASSFSNKRQNDDSYYHRVYKDIKRKRLKRSNARANSRINNAQQVLSSPQSCRHLQTTPSTCPAPLPFLTPPSPTNSIPYSSSSRLRVHAAATATRTSSSSSLSPASSPTYSIPPSTVSPPYSSTTLSSGTHASNKSSDVPLAPTTAIAPSSERVGASALANKLEEDAVAESLIWLGTGSAL